MIQEVDAKANSADERMLKTENTIKEIVTRIKKLATSADMRGMQELIDIYNPLKSSFITREEVEQMLKKNNK